MMQWNVVRFYKSSDNIWSISDLILWHLSKFSDIKLCHSIFSHPHWNKNYIRYCYVWNIKSCIVRNIKYNSIRQLKTARAQKMLLWMFPTKSILLHHIIQIWVPFDPAMRRFAINSSLFSSFRIHWNWNVKSLPPEME